MLGRNKKAEIITDTHKPTLVCIYTKVQTIKNKFTTHKNTTNTDISAQAKMKLVRSLLEQGIIQRTSFTEDHPRHDSA